MNRYIRRKLTSFLPPLVRSYPSGPKGASNSKRPKRVTRSTVGGEGQRKTQTKTVAGGVDFLAGRLSLEVMLHGLIR